MKHLSTYKLFESTNIREDIEDCCLELSDLPFNLYLEEYRTGITDKIIQDDPFYERGEYVTKRMKKKLSKGSYIKLTGEILDDKIGLQCQGKWNDKIESLKWSDFDLEKLKDTTIDNISRKKGGKYMKSILETLPGVLSKLKTYIIGEDKNIEFLVNMYEVERGTCIVIIIEFR